ncbi:MAG: hypothetical protein ACJAUP_003608 [Cellvibrionaceae bacterium]|jgi:hypothetical protein
MSPKRLILIGVAVILLVNGSIFGTLFFVDWLNGPSPEELKKVREAEEAAALDFVYAKLPPLPEFKSKARNLRSIGEAISICESKLKESVKERKSWEVGMIESRYVPATEVYKIFLEYETSARIDSVSKAFNVTCEVSSETKLVDIWQVEPI